MSYNNWQETIPKSEGLYYFYGDLYSKKTDKNFEAELHLVNIISVNGDMIYSISNGEFFYPENNSYWYGKFKLVDIEYPAL